MGVKPLGHHAHALGLGEVEAFITRRVEGADSGREALRALKRRLSDVVYRALQADLAVDDFTLAA